MPLQLILWLKPSFHSLNITITFKLASLFVPLYLELRVEFLKLKSQHNRILFKVIQYLSTSFQFSSWLTPYYLVPGYPSQFLPSPLNHFTPATVLILSLRFTNHISDLKTCPSAGPSAWCTVLHTDVHMSHPDLYLNVTSAERPTMTNLSKIVLPVIFYLLILLFSS